MIKGVPSSPRALTNVVTALGLPATLSLISTIFNGTKHHALAVGLWAATAGLGIALGPVVGGLLLLHFDWPALFWINIAIVLPVAVISPLLVPESRGSNLGRFDTVGVILAIAALGLFVGSIIEGPQLGWTTLPILGGLAASIVLAGAFIAWERRVESPLLDLSLFRATNVTVCSSAIGLAFFSLFGFTFTITIYFQAVRGYSALQAGLAILPFAIVMGACSPLAPVLDRPLRALRHCADGSRFLDRVIRGRHEPLLGGHGSRDDLHGYGAGIRTGAGHRHHLVRRAPRRDRRRFRCERLHPGGGRHDRRRRSWLDPHPRVSQRDVNGDLREAIAGHGR